MQPLSLSLKAGYGIGAVSDSVKGLTFGLFLLFFYTSVRGLPGTMVGAGIAVSLAWDAAVDPLVGRLSDRLSNSRYGRQNLMLLGSLIIGPAFFAVFSPPQALTGLSLLAWLVVTNLVLRTAHSAFMVPYYALGAELTGDYHERTSLTAIRTMFAMAGTMTAAVLSFTVFIRNSGTAMKPSFSADGYSTMALCFGAVMTITAAVSSIALRNARLLRSAEESPRDRQSWLAEFIATLRIRSFRSLTLSGALFFLAAVMNATVAVHYLTYFVQLPDGRPFAAFQAAFFIAAAVGAKFWAAVTRRTEKQVAFRWATAGTAVMMCLAWLLVGQGRPFGLANVTAVVAGNAIAGFLASAVWVLPPSMMADVVDEYERRNGVRPSGTIFGLYSLVVQVAGSFALILNGVLLDHFAHFQSGQQVQTPLTIDRLGLLFGPLPGLLLMLSAISLSGYTLTRRQVQVTQSELKASTANAGIFLA